MSETCNKCLGLKYKIIDSRMMSKEEAIIALKNLNMRLPVIEDFKELRPNPQHSLMKNLFGLKIQKSQSKAGELL